MRPKKYSTDINGIENYVNNLLQLENDEDQKIALKNAQKMGTPPLQVTPFDGRHLEVLSHMLKPKKILEFGTLCGYSAIHLSKGLAPGGHLYTVERSSHHINVATTTFKELNLQNKITIIPGDASQLLPELEKYGKFDLIFLDSDKENYPQYFEWCVENLNAGGTLIADNTFALGYVCENSSNLNEKLAAIVNGIKKYNELCATDKRLKTTLFPTGEGLTVSVKICE